MPFGEPTSLCERLDMLSGSHLLLCCFVLLTMCITVPRSGDVVAFQITL